MDKITREMFKPEAERIAMKNEEDIKRKAGIDPEAEKENYEDTAQKMLEGHELAKKIEDPYWIKDAFKRVGEDTGNSFKRNLKRACEILSEEEGYAPELIEKIYELLEKKRQELH